MSGSFPRPAALWITLLTFTLFIGSNAEAQELTYQVEKSHIHKLGKTKPLRDILKDQPAPVSSPKLSRGDKPSYVHNFVGRREGLPVNPNAKPFGKDPLLNYANSRNGGLSSEPIAIIEGLSQNEASAGVPDVNGDVSSKYYVESVNATWLQVYDLQGNEVGNRFAANTIWNQVDRESAGDPVILFDEEAQRWFMTEFPPQNEVLIAVSDDDDPMGEWTAYAFSTPRFPDYPHYGIWPEAYVLTTNEGGPGLKFYVINRDDILAGRDTVDMQRFTVDDPNAPGFHVATPVGITGSMMPDSTTKPMIMMINDDGWGSVTEDQVEIYEITIDWEDESNTQIDQQVLPTTPFDAEFCSVPGPNFSCVPQPNGVGLDGIPRLIMHRAVYRNFGSHESIVINFAIDVTGDNDAGIRWMEFRKTGDADWTIYQEGTVGSQEGLNRFMGGISIDSKGNIGLAYSVSSEEVHASLRYTGRLVSDPLGMMTLEEKEFATGKGSRSNSRFGDYASMSVDPQDVFWYAGEYIFANGQWGTKIVGFRLQRDSIDIGPGGLAGPADRPDLDNEPLTIEVRNYGRSTIKDFKVGYIFDGGAPVIDDVSLDSLPSDSVYTHTFSQNIQFGGYGSYNAITFTELAADSNSINDTCVFTINKQTRNDAAIPLINDLPLVICDSFVMASIVLQNAGADTLKSAMISYTVNGGEPKTMEWAGELVSGDIELIDVTYTPLIAGMNTITASASMPNGVDDDNEQNNSVEENVQVTPGGGRVLLELTSDLYPDETTWQLLDADDNILFQGGPLEEAISTTTEEWCLDESLCYKFVLFDSYGDGISSYGVEGDFIIRNSDGIIVARLDDPDFGTVDTTEFCLEYECTLQAQLSVFHETTPNGMNGSATIFANSGNPSYRFSKNGGMDYQSSPTFTNLTPGDYVFSVVDAVDCELKIPATILPCRIEWQATVTDASGMDESDGSIDLFAVNGNGNYEYSINGGDDYQSSGLFENLAPGGYLVVVRDSVNCRLADSVDVDFTTAIHTTDLGQTIRIFPNPSQGEFFIEIDGLESEHRIEYEVLGRLRTRDRQPICVELRWGDQELRDHYEQASGDVLREVQPSVTKYYAAGN